MDIIKKFDAPDPSGEENPDNRNTPEKQVPNSEKPGTPEHDKPLKEKIKDALQDWSNDNERDIQEDDSTPLRSGL